MVLKTVVLTGLVALGLFGAFWHWAEASPARELKIVIFGGQSLAFGATGRDWVTTQAQFPNSLMLDFDDPQNGARGWETAPVDSNAFHGFVPRFEVSQESPATGTMNILARAHPEIDFISLHYGKSGESLDFIRDNTLAGLFGQLELIKSYADQQGYRIDPAIELAWIQGQSGSESDYSESLSQHRAEVEARVKEIFGEPFGVTLYTTITRGFGGKTVTGEQFQAIRTDKHILLGSTEVVFNAQYPANGKAANAHLTGEGYYMMGAQIGTHILAKMNGKPIAPIAVEKITQLAPDRFLITFSGVLGHLQEDDSVFADDDFTGVPAHFGIDIYRTNDGRLPGDIVSSRIVDANRIEIVFSKPLSGAFRLWVGRSESKGWMVGGGGAGFGGTTLCDSGQIYSAVPPTGGRPLRKDQLCEFVPQQYFDFTMR
ncbi:hypothetical protein [Celeribacter neptunius]|nr:hypothetical protein [Celeribacter neptunius]